jgi:hypothetical protein
MTVVKATAQPAAKSEGNKQSGNSRSSRLLSQQISNHSTPATVDGDTVPIDMTFIFQTTTTAAEGDVISQGAEPLPFQFNDVVLVNLLHPSMTGKDGILTYAEKQRKMHLTKLKHDHGDFKRMQMYIQWTEGEKEDFSTISEAQRLSFAALCGVKGVAVSVKIEVVCTLG